MVILDRSLELDNLLSDLATHCVIRPCPGRSGTLCWAHVPALGRQEQSRGGGTRPFPSHCAGQFVLSSRLLWLSPLWWDWSLSVVYSCLAMNPSPALYELCGLALIA
jgi:hypothetical protein